MGANRNVRQTVCGTAVGTVGYGLMGLSMPWLGIQHEAASEVMRQALEHGATFWNGVSVRLRSRTAIESWQTDIKMHGIHYGTPDKKSLHLLKYYVDKHPEDCGKVVLSIKGAFGMQTGPTGTPEAIRESVERALEVRQASKKIDIFEMARVDPNVPIETSVKALAELVMEGKIGGIGVSEVGAATVRKAHAVHPIAGVETELSLFTPDALHNGVLETCHERESTSSVQPDLPLCWPIVVGIPVIAYSPIGRGWLSGEFRKLDDLAPDDYRRRMPRFQHGVFEQNFKLVEAVEKLAKRKGVTTAQVAIGWVVCQGAIPIPGSTKVDRVAENASPAELTDEDTEELRRILDCFPISGERYGGAHEKLLNA